MTTGTMPMPKEPTTRSIDPERVRALRRASGLTQSQLAEQTGLSYPSIIAIENGQRRHPAGNTLLALAEFFGVPADALLVGTPADEDPQDKAERRLLERVQRLTPRQRRQLDKVIDRMLGESRADDKS